MARAVRESVTKMGDWVPRSMREKITQYWRSLPDGVPVTFVVKRATRPKTDRQLGYWWGVLLPFVSEATGYTKNEAHEVLMAELMPDYMTTYYCPIRQRHIQNRGSLAEMTTTDVAELFERAWVYLSDRDIHVPHPQDKNAVDALTA